MLVNPVKRDTEGTLFYWGLLLMHRTVTAMDAYRVVEFKHDPLLISHRLRTLPFSSLIYPLNIIKHGDFPLFVCLLMFLVRLPEGNPHYILSKSL